MGSIYNSVILVIFSVDFICIFELSWYPFDTQNCFMNLTLDSSIFVMLAPNDVVYLGEVDLAQYYVKNTTMDADDDFVVVKVTLNTLRMRITLTNRRTLPARPIIRESSEKECFNHICL